MEKLAMTTSTTNEAKEEFGTTIDTLDSLAHGLFMQLPPDFHLKMMKKILPEIVRDLKKQYAEITGDNPWEFHP